MRVADPRRGKGKRGGIRVIYPHIDEVDQIHLVTMSVGASDEDWSNSPEAVADWLAWYDSLEPLEFTLAEQADLAEWRHKIKEYTIANMHKGIDGLTE
jgi:hypothetical protein